MSILVTGGAGYIGSQFVHALLDAGHDDVVVVDNLSTGTREAIPAKTDFFIADVGHRDRMAEIISRHSVDTVAHFAGSIIVPESVADPLKYYGNNTSQSRNLIEVAVAAGVRHFVFSSTAAVYGHCGSEPISEASPVSPVSPYGWSKLMSEQMLRDVGQAHDMRYAILRYFNVAGADPLGRTGQRNPNATHLIKKALLAATGQSDGLVVFGTDYETADGTAVRDYIHVSDLASAHVDAVRYLRGGGPSQVLNCGYGVGSSVLDVIKTVKRVSGLDFPVEYSGRRPGDVCSVIAEASSLRRILKWTPKRDRLEDIVADALSWQRGEMLAHRAEAQDGLGVSAA